MTTMHAGITQGSATDLPAAVLLHSLGLDSSMWRPCARRAVDRRRLIAVDLPAHGRTAPTDDIPTAVLALLDERGLEKVHLAGISVGGATALAVAARAPDRVASVVASGSFAYLDESERQTKIASTAVRANRLGMPAFARAYVAETLCAAAYREAGRELVDVLSAMPLDRFTAEAERCFGTDLRPLLPEVQCPVLLLVGEHDTRAPVSAARRISSLLPQSRIELLSGAGHLANLDVPTAFMATLAAFWAASDPEEHSREA